MDNKNYSGIITFAVGIIIAFTVIYIGGLFIDENLTPISNIFENNIIKNLFVLFFGIAAGYYTILLFNCQDGNKYWLSGFFLTLITYSLFYEKIPFVLTDSYFQALILGFVGAMLISLSPHVNKTYFGKTIQITSSYIFNGFFMFFTSTQYLVPEITIIINFNNLFINWGLIIGLTTLGILSGKFTNYRLRTTTQKNYNQ